MPPKPHLFVRSLLCFLPRGKTAEGADISGDLFKGDSHARHPQRREVENSWDKRVIADKNSLDFTMTQRGGIPKFLRTF